MRLGTILLAIVAAAGVYLYVTGTRLTMYSERVSGGDGGLRVILSAQVVYRQTYPKIGYADSLAKLGCKDDGHPGPDAACLVDNVLASGFKSGYRYDLTAYRERGVVAHYGVIAVPAVPVTGKPRVTYCTDDSGTVRSSESNLQDCLAKGTALK